jgi:hypothetical protein
MSSIKSEIDVVVWGTHPSKGAKGGAALCCEGDAINREWTSLPAVLFWPLGGALEAAPFQGETDVVHKKRN